MTITNESVVAIAEPDPGEQRVVVVVEPVNHLPDPILRRCAQPGDGPVYRLFSFEWGESCPDRSGCGRRSVPVAAASVERVPRRREFNRRHRNALAALPGVSFMPEGKDCYSTFWLTCIAIDPAEAGVDQEAFRSNLEALNVESRPVWKPMHQLPVFADTPPALTGISDKLFDAGLCLPSVSANDR